MTPHSPEAVRPIDFFKGFARTLVRRPGPALGAAYWWITGRKLRARNRLRLTMAQLPNAYRIWIERVENQSATLAEASNTISGWQYRPRFSILIVLAAGWDDGGMEAAIESVRSQCYDDWELLVAGASGPAASIDDRIREVKAGAANDWEAVLDSARNEFILPLATGAILPPTALYRYAEALQSVPDANLLYGDQDELAEDGTRQNPWLKPLWNDEMAFAQDYLSEASAIRTKTARELLPDALRADPAIPFALALAAALRDETAVVHVPHVQCHFPSMRVAHDEGGRLGVVRRLLEPRGARVKPREHGLLSVEWPLPDTLPLVSIIVPTRDKLGLLRTCVSSVFDKTAYAPFELIIIDNGSREADALSYLADIAKDPRVRVLRDDGPFNFSRLNNVAAAQANGDLICLLNNDTEVIAGNWLTEMVRYAVRPEIGAVGAKLIYEDGSIQHAGVVIGLGDAAGHAHRFQRSGEPGYFRRADIPHVVSAVTAACLVVDKHKFRAVGGFDEEGFKVAFNDVDLCLKLQRAGWQNVYQPSATLFHYESKSRGRDTSPKHIKRYQQELKELQARWSTKGFVDPLHHPALYRESETYLIRFWTDANGLPS